jgi:DNA polymerase-3 subunit epsilon
VVHNAPFDIGFLNAEFERAGYPPLPLERAVDTVLLARRKFPGAPAKLDDLCKRFNIDNSRRSKHGALLDAELLSEVYLELIGARQGDLGLGLGAEGGREGIFVGRSYADRTRRLHTPTAEERERHRAFLATLKNPLWTRP